jgi:hypothetical protein
MRSKTVRQEAPRKRSKKKAPKTLPRRSLFELMKDACGVVDSGVPDLATNKKYLDGFGRDNRRPR